MSQQFCERAQNIARYKFQEKSKANDEFHKSLDIDNKRDGQFKVDNHMIEKIEMWNEDVFYVLAETIVMQSTGKLLRKCIVSP